MDLKKFAASLPYPIQQPLRYIYGAIPPSIRYGRVFRETYAFLQESQWWSREKLEEYQMQQLSKLLNHAYENVPYYRRVFDERGLKPKDIQDFDDLRKLPYLTKEIIRENLPDLVARNMSKSRLHFVRTSGSTVSPLAFYCERGRTVSSELAFIWTMWNLIGYQFRDRRVNLGIELVSKKGSWWEFDPANNSLTLSPYHMSEENLYKYANKIREFKPKAIKAIPSAIFVLADFMQRHRIGSFPSVKVILCGSEMLYAWQRKRIEEAFNCRLFSWYGQIERVVLAGECEESNQYHVFPEYGVTEVIGQSGEQVTQDGELGEIVGTGFNNYAMPLIRYKIGDIAVWTNKRCKCKREYPLLDRIEGREQEFIVFEEGHLIPITALPYSELIFNVEQFQFYQENPGEVILKVVRRPAYTEKDSERILKGLNKELGDIKVNIEFVDHIPRTKRGKYLYIIQKLPIKFGNEKRKNPA